MAANCNTCAADAPILFEWYPWYDPTFTCLHCGEVWHGADRADRPFAPGWRKQNIDRAYDRLFANLEKYYEIP